jgi:preprotein translocase subunit SecA
MGLKEGEVIQHSMISKSIERAQKKVEENNFGIRKRLLEYDDVMNSQREVIYKRRRHALYGERIGVDIVNLFYDVCEGLIAENHGFSDYQDFRIEILRVLSIEISFDEKDYLKLSQSELSEILYNAAVDSFKRKVETIGSQAWPVIKDVYENQSGQYENIVVPISDGKRIYNITTNLKNAFENEGKEVVRDFEKASILVTIDDAWKEHLREMDELKQSVQNASYEQKDPLLIYKFESFELFKQMVEKINREIISILMKAHIPISSGANVQRGQVKQLDMSKYETTRTDSSMPAPPQGGNQEAKKEPVKVDKKIGRNDPCPCGSGKKYKNCHGRAGAEAL